MAEIMCRVHGCKNVGLKYGGSNGAKRTRDRFDLCYKHYYMLRGSKELEKHLEYKPLLALLKNAKKRCAAVWCERYVVGHKSNGLGYCSFHHKAITVTYIPLPPRFAKIKRRQTIFQKGVCGAVVPLPASPGSSSPSVQTVIRAERESND